MEYSFGYVAFIDILGFSNLVLDENNIEIVDKLLHFVKKFKWFYNNSPELNVQVSFFSDSLVLTTEMTNHIDLGKIIYALHIAEMALFNQTGLLFRGGITKGKFLHSNSTVFGPAVIRAYQLESKAKYCRVMIDPVLIEEKEASKTLDQAVELIKDFDGCYYISNMVLHVRDKYSDQITYTAKEVYQSLTSYRNELIKTVNENIDTDIVEKYLWRCVDYNRKLKKIEGIMIAYGIQYQEEDLIRLKSLLIDLDSIVLNTQGEHNDQL